MLKRKLSSALVKRNHDKYLIKKFGDLDRATCFEFMTTYLLKHVLLLPSSSQPLTVPALAQTYRLGACWQQHHHVFDFVVTLL